jgi:hypothetical protein
MAASPPPDPFHLSSPRPLSPHEQHHPLSRVRTWTAGHEDKEKEKEEREGERERERKFETERERQELERKKKKEREKEERKEEKKAEKGERKDEEEKSNSPKANPQEINGELKIEGKEHLNDEPNPKNPSPLSPPAAAAAALDSSGHPEVTVQKKRMTLLRIHDISRSDRIARESERGSLCHTSDGVEDNMKVKRHDCGLVIC